MIRPVRAPAIAFLLAAIAQSGCGQIGFDAIDAGDASESDGAIDAPRDAGGDALSDVGGDAKGDAGTDAGTDAGDAAMGDGAVDGAIDGAIDGTTPTTLVSLNPRTLPLAGGTLVVVLDGAGLTSSIRVDGMPCTVERRVDARTIECEAPAHPEGTVEVTAVSPASAGGISLSYLRPGMVQVGGPRTDNSSGIAIGADGAIYVSGGTDGDLGAPGAGDFDAFVAKFAPHGALEWTRQLGTAAYDYARDVVVAPNGDVLIAGYTAGDLDGAGSNAGGNDVFVARYDGSGTLRWITLVGTPQDDQSWDLGVDATGASYVAIRTTGSLSGTSAGGQDFAIAKLDAGGVLSWVEQGGTAQADIGHSIAVRPDGVAFLVGYTLGDLEGTNAGGQDLFVARYERDGTRSWLRQRGSAGDDFAYDAITDGTDNVWVVGRTTGDLDGNTNVGAGDILLMRFSSDGVHGFTRTFGGTANDVTFGVDVSSAGDVFIGGNCAGAFHGETALGMNDMCVISFDRTGTRRWTRFAGGPASDSPSSCAVDRAYSGLVYISFITTGALGGGPNNGGADYGFARFTTDGELL